MVQGHGRKAEAEAEYKIRSTRHVHASMHPSIYTTEQMSELHILVIDFLQDEIVQASEKGVINTPAAADTALPAIDHVSETHPYAVVEGI